MEFVIKWGLRYMSKMFTVFIVAWNCYGLSITISNLPTFKTRLDLRILFEILLYFKNRANKTNAAFFSLKCPFTNINASNTLIIRVS